MNRTAGILLSVSSLPSKYGIGCFSKSAYEFADWLKEAGQSYWQILPLGPTSYGDSPYQSFSTYAGNPYFISLEDLIEEGVLTEKECEKLETESKEGTIDYKNLAIGHPPARVRWLECSHHVKKGNECTGHHGDSTGSRR